jgi:nucleoside-diphosphate-sugar epimerase
MKVLLTGASSFTGTWFATALRSAGHAVVATLQGRASDYTDLRAHRVTSLRNAGVSLVESCSFGDERFLGLVQDGFDVICHHGAYVTNYKSLDFDIIKAVHNNTLNMPQVVEAAARHGVKAFVVTGSVFEQDEGLGPEPRRAFSPYGLSKGLSWQVLRYWGDQLNHPVHKFVIPNPFGPFEEPRFCAYLMSKWSKGEAAQIGTPAYIRDNIHVSLLAKSYCDFVEHAVSSGTPLHYGPSGYVESQGTFARRFALEIGARLGLEATLAFANQTKFEEPEMRINTHRPSLQQLGWDEVSAWDELAAYYRNVYLTN